MTTYTHEHTLTSKVDVADGELVGKRHGANVAEANNAGA